MVWSSSTLQLALLVPLVLLTVNTIRRIIKDRIERKGHPLPPGPIPLVFLGNALSVDAQMTWLSFTKWRAKYGDIIYIRMLDTDVIVVNSTSVATDLLVKRSRIYSDRPSITAVVAPYYDFNFSFARYGEYWRLCRRIFLQTFRADAALRFRSMQLRRAQQLVVNMVDDPDAYPAHFSTFSSATVLSAVYDYEPSPRNDRVVSIVDKFLQVGVPALAPGRMFLVKTFPFLLHMPAWLPGSWISREAREAHLWRDEMVNMPYRDLQRRMDSRENVNPSMVSDHIARMNKFTDGSYREEYDSGVKGAAATAVNGATDTTSSTLMVFTLAMVQNPHVWKRAQGEIDAVVGTDRLPDFDDRSALPYVEAITREVFRWRPVLPLGGPHSVTQSDIYEGYYIPKGAMVIGNTWAMSRDEARYPNGDEFIPERFLDGQGTLTDDEPYDFIFGFGRRRCPGRHTADATVWSAIVTMLATLDFESAKDADGNDIAFTVTFTHGATSHPNQFPCQITLRRHVNKEALGRVFIK